MYESLRREIAKMNDELPARPTLVWADGRRESSPLGMKPLAWLTGIMTRVGADPEAARHYAGLVGGEHCGLIWEFIAALAASPVERREEKCKP